MNKQNNIIILQINNNINNIKNNIIQISKATQMNYYQKYKLIQFKISKRKMEKYRTIPIGTKSFTIDQIKECLFYMFDQISSSNICNPSFVIILITVETLLNIHLLSICVHFVAGIDQYAIEIALKYLNPAIFLATTESLIYTLSTFLIISYLFLFSFFLLLLSQWNFQQDDRHSLIYYYFKKVIGVQQIFFTQQSFKLLIYIAIFFNVIFVMQKHVLDLPILLLLMETINCKYHIGDGKFISPGFECYEGLHLCLIAASALAIILMSCFMLASLILFSDEQLKSKLPWAFCSRHLDIYKYLRKFYLCFLLCFCTSSEELFMISSSGLFLLSFGCLYELFYQIHMNYLLVYYALSTSECLTFFISLLAPLNLIGKRNWLNPIILVMILIALTLFAYLFSIYKRKRLMLGKNIEDLQEISEIEIYSRVLIDLSNSRSIDSKIAIHGIIAFHSSRCHRQLCYCRKLSLLEERELQELDFENSYMQNNNLEKNDRGLPIKQMEAWNSEIDASIISSNAKAETKQKSVLFKFLIDMINKLNESQDKKVRLQLLLTYLKLNYYESPLPALYQLMCARELSPNLFEEYLIFRSLRQIEEKMMLKEAQESSNEIENLISFQQILAEMQENMEESLKLFIGFWKELLDESPNFQYIGNISYDIAQHIGNIRREYSQLIEINPTNLYCRMLYALFLKKIIQDEYEAYDVHEQISITINNIRIRSAYQNEDKLSFNDHTSLLIISGENEDLGKVLSMNNEVSEMLGYGKSDILGHNICHLMNPALASVHNQLILNFYNSGAASKTSESLIFPLHKIGYLVPCTYLHSTSLNVSRGLQLIGFIHQIKKFGEYDIIFCFHLQQNAFVSFNYLFFLLNIFIIIVIIIIIIIIIIISR